MEAKSLNSNQVTQNILTKEITKIVQVITEISNNFQQNPNSLIISQTDFGHIRQQLNNLTKEDLANIQQSLQQEGIEIKGHLAEMQSPKTRADSIINAITAFKEIPQSNEFTLIGTVTCSYFERSNYDYFVATKDGDVVCLIPFMACNENYISSENTCKVGEKMKDALLAYGQKPRILQALDNYLADLKNDFHLHRIWEDKKYKEDLELFLSIKLIEFENQPVLHGKIKRYLQLIRYKHIIEQFINDPQLIGDLTASLKDAKLPSPVRKILENSNAVSFLIAPQMKESDSYLRFTPANLFSLERDCIIKIEREGISKIDNPLYSQGFVVDLHTSLRPLQQKLQQKRISTTLTEESLQAKIKQEYFNLTHRYDIQESNIPNLRHAVINVIKTLSLTNEADYVSIISQPFFNKYGNEIIPDAQLFDFIVKIGLFEATIEDFLPFILLKEQQQELMKEVERSPFDEPSVISLKQYNELIQIFLATACICYYEYTNSNDLSPERINFGRKIESEVEPGTVVKKQFSLIQDIVSAINQSKPLEDTLLNWIENHLLASQQDIRLKKFTPETKQRIKSLFRAGWQLFYTGKDGGAPHIDEFLYAMANRLDKPKVVLYRITMSIPLDVFCENYVNQPRLKKEFENNPYRVSLPKAENLEFELDKVTISTSNSVLLLSQTYEIKVMEQLNYLITKQDSEASAKLLLHKTTTGKKVYSLLNKVDVNQLLSQANWSDVSNKALALLSIDEAKLFKEKFRLHISIHLTREYEHALYAEYYKSSPHLVLDNVSREEKIKKALKSLKCELTKMTKTSASTYILEFSNANSIERIQLCYQENKTCLHITPTMAACFYRKAGDLHPDDELLAFASTRRLLHKIHILESNSKFPHTLKTLFPDLVILVTNEPMPKGKTEQSPDVIRVDFNSCNIRYGYEITSTNVDNLNRIRDDYEVSMTHNLGNLQAGKILQSVAEKLNISKPIRLSTETLELALDELGIIYNSIVEIGSLYQIVCNESDWSNLKTQSEKISFIDNQLVDLSNTSLNAKIVKSFFEKIRNLELDEAKDLVARYPELLNIKVDKDESPTLIYVLKQANQNLYEPENFKKLLEFCLYLISQPGIDLLDINKSKNTALHLSIRFAAENASMEKYDRCEAFDSLSLAMWEQTRIERGSVDEEVFGLNDKEELIFGTSYRKSEPFCDYDPDDRLENKICKQTFWNLLYETRYFDFNNALNYISTVINSIKTWGELKEQKLKFLNQLMNTRHPQSKKFPLQMAIEKANITAIDKLFNLGANVNQRLDITGNDKLTETPLGLALTLRESNKDPNLTKSFENTIATLIYYGANFSGIQEVVAHLHQKQNELHEKLQQAQEQIRQQQLQFDKLKAAKEHVDILLSKQEPELFGQLQRQTILTAQIEEIKAKIETSQKNYEILSKSSLDLTLENNNLRAAITYQTSELDVLNKDSEDLKVQVRNKQAEIVDIKSQKEELLQQVTLLSKQTQESTEKLEHEKQEQNRLRREIELCSQQNLQNTAALEQLSRTAQTLEININTQRKNNESLAKELKEEENKQVRLKKAFLIQKNTNKLTEDTIERRSHCIHFFIRLEKLPEYQRLVSDLRIAEIQRRIDSNSSWQSPVKNTNKINALNELKEIVTKKSLNFTDAYKFINDNEAFITQSTRRDNHLFFKGEVTSAELFRKIKQFFDEEKQLLIKDMMLQPSIQ